MSIQGGTCCVPTFENRLSSSIIYWLNFSVDLLLNKGVTSLNTGIGSREKTLGDAVQFHVQRYFDFHGAELPPPGVYHRILKEIEIPLLEIALYSSAGNQAKCADMLGLNRNTLRKKINEFDIAVKRRRKLM